MKKFIIIVVCLLITTISFAGGFYSRSNWKHWIDSDNDGQDTRIEVLMRDSIVPVKFKDKVVWSGLWICPYTNQIFVFADRLDIDHIVPLKYAYEHGAENWTKEQKEEFANDPYNLLAVSASANRSKGQKGIDRWFPDNACFVSEYVIRFNEICERYGLRKE